MNIQVLIQIAWQHYGDVIMGAIASEFTGLKIVYSSVYSDADQRKHQSSASLAFVRGIHRGPVNSPHKWPVTRKMFPFDYVIMKLMYQLILYLLNIQCAVWFNSPPLDKMATISQTICLDSLYVNEKFYIWLKFQWSLYLRVRLTITQHWFRQ